MKINPSDPRLPGTGPAPAADRPSTALPEATIPGGQADPSASRTPSASLRLSSTALEAASPGAVMGAAGTFDSDRVEKLRAVIESGSYRVDPELIADRLIGFARERLSPHTRSMGVKVFFTPTAGLPRRLTTP